MPIMYNFDLPEAHVAYSFACLLASDSLAPHAATNTQHTCSIFTNKSYYYPYQKRQETETTCLTQGLNKTKIYTSQIWCAD